MRLGVHGLKLTFPAVVFLLLRDSDRPVETIPISILQFCQQDTQTGAFSLPEGRRLLQYRVIVCTCNDANILYCLGLTNQQIRHRRRCFENYIRRECEDFCMSPPTIPGAHLPHFTHFYMDEAAQATEPESLICLSGTLLLLDTNLFLLRSIVLYVVVKQLIFGQSS